MSDIDPIIPDLPSVQAQLQRKYQTLGPQLAQVPLPIRNTAVNLDATRVARGQRPLSGPETIRAVGAAVLGRPITPPPERSSSPFDIIGNFASDIRNIGMALPHLPGAIIDEVQAIPNFQKEMQANGFWSAPGVRMLPGAFTARAIQEGNLTEQLVQNPALSILDITPFAKGITRLPMPGGGTVKSAAAATRPAQAIARPVRAAQAAARATGPGQWWAASFGQQARDVAQLSAQQDRLIQEAATPSRPGGRFSRDRPATDMSDTIYGADDLAAQETDLLRRTVEARETYAHIPPERQAALTDAAESGEWANIIDNLPDDEAAYLRFAKDTSDELAAIGQAEGYLLDFKGELYDQVTGKALRRGQATLDYATNMRNVRNAILNPSTDPSTLVQLARTAAESDTLSAVRKTEVLRGVSHALDTAGFDGKAVRESLRLTDPRNPSRVTPDDVVGVMDDVVAAGPTAGTITQPQLLDWLKRYRRDNVNVRLAIANIEAGNYTAARKNVQAIVKARNVDSRLRADMSVLPDQISAIGEQRRFLAKTERYSDEVVEGLAKKIEGREAATIPARFMPSIQSKVREGLLAKYATDPDFDTISQMIERGQFSTSPALKADAQALTREMAGTWKAMKDEGLDPIFVHHVSPAAAKSVDFPRVPLAERAPSWAQKRTMDYTPYAKNMSVALNRQALDLVGRRGAEALVDSIVTTYGRRRFSTDAANPGLDDIYRAKAEAQAQVNPTLDINARIDDLINREYVRFDANAYTPWRSGRGGALSAAEEVFVPKAVAKVLQDTYNPKTYAFQAVLDPVMNLFRTSVLALAPRWHVNNTVGGAFMVAMEDPLIFTKLPKVLRQMRSMSGEVDTPVGPLSRTQMRRQGATGTGMGSLPAQAREWHKTGKLPTPRDRAIITHSLYAGRTMRRLLDQGGKVIDKSYAMNQFVDDMYRSMAYLRGYDKAVRRGSKKVNLADEGIEGATARTMTREAAEEAGLSLATKIFQNWDRMTPFERNVMRYAFPFYGWMSHIAKYTLRYPVDHPIRASIIGSFAKHELDDMQDRGLPDSFLNFFFLGNTDENGNQRAVSLGALNPFSSVGDSFTLAGLVGNANPMLGSFLTAIGIDPISGEAELYPDMTYDPNTGRYGVKTPGMMGSLAGSIFPQAQALLSLVGQNSKYKELLRTNPDSAVNMLRSQSGLPVIFRNLPLIETQMKSELTRDDVRTQAFNKALKTGGVADLQAQYPGLAPVIDQLRAADESGALDQYRIAPSGPDSSQGSMFYEALVERTLGTGEARRLGGAYTVQSQLLGREMPWQQ